MPKGGKLSIYAYRKEGSLVIEVQDTGEGIPDEVKDKLFTPMFTTKSKRSRVWFAHSQAHN